MLLNTLFRIELIASTLLIAILLILGVVRKAEILSDTALERLRAEWRRFKMAFYIGLVSMVLFLGLLSLEMLEATRGAELRSLHPLATEYLKLTLLLSLFIVNIINLSIVLSITGGSG